jgi:hypothetical protein
MRRSLRTLALSLGALSALIAAVVCTDAHADEARRAIPIAFQIADSAGKPVADDAFVASELEHANAIYRELGIELVDVSHHKLAQRHARIVERRDRDALGPLLRPGVINVFVVGCLMDVDEPGRERRGVHWRVRSDKQRHFVIVSAISGPYVLAHELGHFLGNPEHSDVPGNLMSYQHTEAVPVLDAAQRERVAHTVAALFASGELALPGSARRKKKTTVAPSSEQTR